MLDAMTPTFIYLWLNNVKTYYIIYTVCLYYLFKLFSAKCTCKSGLLAHWIVIAFAETCKQHFNVAGGQSGATFNPFINDCIV